MEAASNVDVIGRIERLSKKIDELQEDALKAAAAAARDKEVILNAAARDKQELQNQLDNLRTDGFGNGEHKLLLSTIRLICLFV
jgi:hypothetical protein